jgi:outer membrane protein OmpA-like peptidoglycan-associated protein
VVTDEAQEIVKNVADSYKQCPNGMVQVIGNNDAEESGSLSGYRADQVRAALITAGVPADHIRTQAAGSSNPMAESPDVRNRRIDAQLIGGD